MRDSSLIFCIVYLRMASYQRTENIDILNVRKILAKGDNNTMLTANKILITDGKGGTMWVDKGTFTGTPVSFDTIRTTQATFTSGLGNTQFSILDGPNAGCIPVSGSPNTVQLYAKAFSQINVDGQNSVNAFNQTTGIIQSTLKFVGSGITDILTDSSQNIIRFNTPNYANSTISSIITNISNLNNSISTTAGNFTTPFSSFIYNSISSFSTSLGGPVVTTATVATKISTITLNTSTLNILGSRQPLIQYNRTSLDQYGNTIVTLPIPYINTNYNVQLTYNGNAPPAAAPTKILYTTSLTTSNFTVYGDSNAQFNWVTFGNPF